MKKEDDDLLYEIQKNAQMAVKAIETIAEKTQDSQLTNELARELSEYLEFEARAMHEVSRKEKQIKPSGKLAEMILEGGIHINTITNCSNSHIADLMIRESSKSNTKMCQAIHKNEAADAYYIELARELMDFEESSIQRLKRFL